MITLVQFDIKLHHSATQNRVMREYKINCITNEYIVYKILSKYFTSKIAIACTLKHHY